MKKLKQHWNVDALKNSIACEFFDETEWLGGIKIVIWISILVLKLIYSSYVMKNLAF